MANLKVIVPLLNKRSQPVEDTTEKGNVLGKVKAGFQFESVEQLKNAAGDWFRDRDGSWYWGGGLGELIEKAGFTSSDDIKSFLDVAQFPPEPIRFNKMLIKFPISIKSNNGKGITVAVLDSGLDETHLDLSQSIVAKKDFTNAAAGENDIIGHGTSMASLIAANSFFSDKGVSGVSSSAKIISACFLKTLLPFPFSSGTLAFTSSFHLRKGTTVSMPVNSFFMAGPIGDVTPEL